jgi:hypothetical protein
VDIDRERLAAFIFRLGRDAVPFGVIEEHVQVVEGAHVAFEPIEYLGSVAKTQADWAREIAARLLTDDHVRADA